MTEKERQRLAELTECLFRGEPLEDSQLAELRNALARSPEARKEFVIRSELESALADTGEHGVLGPVRLLSQPPAKRRTGPTLVASLAAAATLVLGLGFWWFSNSMRSDGTTPPGLALGTVRSMEGNNQWQPGADFTAGEHELKSGIMEVRLDSGVRLKVVGPARYSLEDAMGMRLISGRMSAEVPPSAAGFRVDANDMAVVDLGTRFAVTADTNGNAAVHVFDGEVRAETGRASEPLHLESGETARLNVNAGTLEPIDFDQDQFTAPPAWLGIIASHSDNVEVLEDPPLRAHWEDLPQGHPVIFRERRSLVLERDLSVDLLPGAEAEDAPQEVTKGRRISSYLVHARGKSGRTRVEGEVRFDSPVVAIIYRSALLDRTDSIVGSNKTDYPSSSRIRGVDKLERRQVKVGEDRRSVSFSIHAPTIDQFRILVAED